MAVTMAGTPEVLGPKRRNTTIAFNNNGSARDTITDSGNQFLIVGFQPGDQIAVTGATNGANNATWVIYDVEAGTITLTRNNVLTTEAAGATVQIKANKVVPEGIMIDVKARNANTDLIHVGFASVNANKDNNQSFTLRNNEDVELQVRATNDIWLDASVSGESVEVIFEKNPQTT